MFYDVLMQVFDEYILEQVEFFLDFILFEVVIDDIFDDYEMQVLYYYLCDNIDLMKWVFWMMINVYFFDDGELYYFLNG